MTIPVTVALMTYNRSGYLKESLAAIVNQTYKNFEILVLDNGSTDDTHQVVFSFKDERIRYVKNAPGHTARFNGLSALWIARGQRLLITHDDDVMLPDMLEKQMKLLDERPEITAVWTNQSVIGTQGETLQEFLSPPGDSHIFAVGEYIARAAGEKLWHPPSSMLFTPKLLPLRDLKRKYLGEYSSEASGHRKRKAIDGSGDHILTATMNLHGPVAFINEPLLKYRIHPGQESNHMHLSQAILYRYESFKRFIRYTPLKDQYLPIFDAHILRFKAQDKLIYNSETTIDKGLLRFLQNSPKTVLSRGSASAEVLSALLPVIILMIQLRQAKSVIESFAEAFNNLEVQENGFSEYFLSWLKVKCQDGNVFKGFDPKHKIVIFGSSFVAALLVIEARLMGLSIAFCVDSNLGRQGTQLLGVPIVPPTELSKLDESFDIFLSSERAHEQELQNLIRGFNDVALIRSWKDFFK